MADPSDAMLCQHTNGGSRIAHHDVERQRRLFSEPSNQSDIYQARCKDPVCTRICVCACSLNRFSSHGISVMLRWCLKKDVGSNIEEEMHMDCIDCLPDTANTAALISSLAKFSIRGKAVFQIAADSSCIDHPPHRLADFFRGIAIAGFQIERHWHLSRADNPAQIVDRQLKRDALAVGKAVDLCHGPTAGRDCFGASFGDCLGAACIPDVEEHKWASRDV